MSASITVLLKGGPLGGELRAIPATDLHHGLTVAVTHPLSVRDSDLLPRSGDGFHQERYEYEGEGYLDQPVMRWVNPIPNLVKERNSFRTEAAKARRERDWLRSVLGAAHRLLDTHPAVARYLLDPDRKDDN